MKQLIINADDFGLSPGVNRGIIEGYQNGIITSTTLMANMPGFVDAVEHARENPGLGVGIHLNLTWGKPVAPDIPTLIEPQGTFYGSHKIFAYKLFTGSIRADDIKQELDAQIGKIMREKICISHLDSHQHILIFPSVFRVVQELMLKYDIRSLRLPMELTVCSDGKTSIQDRINKYVANILCRKHKKKLDKKVRICDSFYGISCLGKVYGSRLERIINNLEDGVSEISCHPGYRDKTLIESESKLLECREKELDALTDRHFKELIDLNNIKLINFNDLPG